MKRYKSIDTLRGISIVWMIVGHLSEWWITLDNLWFFDVTRAVGDFLGSGAFLFLSGVSAALSYRGKLLKAKKREDYSIERLRKEYFLRASLLFIIAILYNILEAIIFQRPTDIWIWFILLTISISLFLAWPLFKVSKRTRIIIGFFVWIVNQGLINLLSPFQGQFNTYGIIFHILYNNLELDPILSFFTFFIVGTVVGETLFECNQNSDIISVKQDLKTKLLKPTLFSGIILVLFGISFMFPQFTHHRTFPWLIYSLGMELIIISIALNIEEILEIKLKKRFRFFYFFSYYSFTVYLGHNILYFLFLHQLYPFLIWINIVISIIIIYIILRILYKYAGPYVSLKSLIGIISSKLALKNDVH
ncbi:MAG: heparan-alpha-glucosaminide N-acetyltransferase domain-containing protein [Candidatus Lokiarchaeota archaeon]